MWKRMRFLFEENEKAFRQMEPSESTPSTKFWRESAHSTLGHLVACQAAWLPIMRGLKGGEAKVIIPVNPDPLYRQLRFATWSWETLLDRFLTDRDEWRQIIAEVDTTKEIRTAKRVWSTQTLTRRLVEHEKLHLDQLGHRDELEG